MTAAASKLLDTPAWIVQDGAARSPEDLEAAVAVLCQALHGEKLRRVAVCSARADTVSIALRACLRKDIELLLLRRRPSPATLADWDVNAVIEDDLSLSAVGNAAACAPGFAVLLTTSGTTGTPKIARHGFDRLAGRIRLPADLSQPSVWLLAYHPASFAGMQVLLTALSGGGKLLSDAGLTVPALADLARRFGATHISATPTFWRALLMILGESCARLPLRQATLGGERVDQAILDRIKALFPDAGVTHIYASTEAGALFAVRDGRAGFPAAWLEQTVEGVQLRLRDGVLQVRSPRAMHGYVPGTGADPLTSDGWMDTRDRAGVVGDRIEFLGRRDAMINVGGGNVSPEEVEAVLLQVPGIADVRVSGLKNPISGEVVCAELVVQPGHAADEVRRAALALARRELQPYQVPRVVRVVDVIEYSESGKKVRK